MLIVAALYVSPKTSAHGAIAEVSVEDYGDSYRAGTHFEYEASGVYNGTKIVGTYYLNMVLWSDGFLAQYGGLNTTVPELDQMMNGDGGNGPFDYASPYPNLDLTNVYH